MAITVTAGQRVTAAMLNAFVPKYVVQGSDQALTTSAGNWNVGAISIAAGETWVVDVLLDYGNMSSAANNLQTSWSTPTGTLVAGRLFTMGAAGGTSSVSDTNGGFMARPHTQSTSYGGTTSTGTTRGAARHTFTLAGGVSGGTVTLSLNLSAGTATLYAGSFYVAHRVS
jgi:hypothetical protein